MKLSVACTTIFVLLGCLTAQGEDACPDGMKMCSDGYCQDESYCCTDEEWCYDENWEPSGCAPLTECCPGTLMCGGMCTGLLLSDGWECCGGEAYIPSEKQQYCCEEGEQQWLTYDCCYPANQTFCGGDSGMEAGKCVALGDCCKAEEVKCGPDKYGEYGCWTPGVDDMTCCGYYDSNGEPVWHLDWAWSQHSCDVCPDMETNVCEVDGQKFCPCPSST